MGYCNWSSAALALTFHVSCSNLFCILIKASSLRSFTFYVPVGAITSKVFHVTVSSSSNLLCMLLITSSRSRSIKVEKNSKWPIYCDFSHLTSLILPCGCDNFEICSCILLKFATDVAINQFLDNFNHGWKKIKMDDLLGFFWFFVNNSIL